MVHDSIDEEHTGTQNILRRFRTHHPIISGLIGTQQPPDVLLLHWHLNLRNHHRQCRISSKGTYIKLFDYWVDSEDTDMWCQPRSSKVSSSASCPTPPGIASVQLHRNNAVDGHEGVGRAAADMVRLLGGDAPRTHFVLRDSRPATVVSVLCVP